MDHARFKDLIGQLYAVVDELEAMFPGRHFSPDGHMVGSIGECLVADAYGLDLKTASNKGFDAVTRDGIQVEIKATQGRSVAFRSEPEYAIIIKILRNGSFEEIYNGPGDLVWGTFAGKKTPTNGQFKISLVKLNALNKQVKESSRIPRLG